MARSDCMRNKLVDLSTWARPSLAESSKMLRCSGWPGGSYSFIFSSYVSGGRGTKASGLTWTSDETKTALT